jgi:transcriptional regulator with XRE-family HTH domain
MVTSAIRSGSQIRAARALLGWGQSQLAEGAGVAGKTIERAEATSALKGGRTLRAIEDCLVSNGIVFVDTDEGLGVLVRHVDRTDA